LPLWQPLTSKCPLVSYWASCAGDSHCSIKAYAFSSALPQRESPRARPKTRAKPCIRMQTNSSVVNPAEDNRSSPQMSDLPAAQSGKEHRLVGRGIEVANELRGTCTPAHGWGLAGTSQLFEPCRCLCNGSGVRRIEFIPCVARSVHHELLGHDRRPFV
jgi:hypothetical protein